MVEFDYYRLAVDHVGRPDVAAYWKGHAARTLLVDIDTAINPQSGIVADAVNHLAREVETHPYVVVRLPDHEDQPLPTLDGARLAAAELLSAIRLRVPSSGQSQLACLIHPLGKSARLVTEHDDDRLGFGINEIRSAEILAMMSLGECTYKPNGFTFELPSGELASSFTRFSDCIRTQRDARVLALWVYGSCHALGARFGVMIDTPGLLPVTGELRQIVRHGGQTVDHVEVVPAYPYGVGDIESSARKVLGPNDGVLAIISVSASGHFLGLVDRALNQGLFRDRESRIVVLHERHRSTASHGSRWRVDTYSLVESNDTLPPGEPSRPIVAVEPSNLRLRPRWEPTSPALIAEPHGSDAAYLNMLAESRALGVECTPHGDKASVRPRTRLLSFRVVFESLIRTPGFVDRLLESRGLAGGSLAEWASGFEGVRDSVVLPESDADMTSGDFSEVRAVLRALGAPEDAQIVRESQVDSLGEPGRVLLFCWGSVTGATLVRSQRRIAAACSSADVGCMVVHLRPPSEREVESLEGLFGEDRFWTGWTHFVPWASTFAPEAARIVEFVRDSPAVDDSIRDTLDNRLAVLLPTGDNRDWEYRISSQEGAQGESARTVFWLHPAETGTGWVADAPTCLYAAAIALQHVRIRSGSEPVLIDVLSQCVADQSPNFVAALLRVSRIGEIWFGSSPTEQREAADHVCDWIDTDLATRGVVLGELLAAGALGKVPRPASQALRSFAETVVADRGLPQPDLEVVECLLAYSAWAWMEGGPASSERV